MQIYVGIIFIFFSAYAFSETGYVFSGDLNGDGIDDTLESGPSSMFGNAGGPFLLTLSSDNTFVFKVLGFHPHAISLEKHKNGNKLWSYWRLSSNNGSLRSVFLDENFKEEHVHIQSGNSGTVQGNRIYKALFNEKYLLKMIKKQITLHLITNGERLS